MSKDEALENAIKVSTQPHPFYLCSKLGLKPLAFALVSQRRVFRLCYLGQYTHSVAQVHEQTHIEDATGTHFKKLAIFVDFAYRLGVKDIRFVDNQTGATAFHIDTAVMEKWLGKSGWTSFMEASAIYSQLIHDWTPNSLKLLILDDLPLRSRDALNYYFKLDDIVRKFLDKYSGEGYRFDPELEERIKTIVVRSILRVYAYGNELDNRVNTLLDLQKSEIPEWSQETQIASFILEDALNDRLRHPTPFLSLNNMFQLIMLTQAQNTRKTLRDFMFGLCQDLIIPFGRFPIVYFDTKDESLQQKEIIGCDCHHFVNKENVLRYGKPATEQQLRVNKNPEVAEDYKRVIEMLRPIEREAMQSLCKTMSSTLKRCLGSAGCLGKKQCPLASKFTRRMIDAWQEVYPKIFDSTMKSKMVDMQAGVRGQMVDTL